MRRILGLFALLALAVPLAAFAAVPGAVAPPSAPANPVIDQLLTPQEIAAATSPDAQLDLYFLSQHITQPVTLSGGGVVYPATWVCRISCRACNVPSACGPGDGLCVPYCP
jgi:hypothetical protein